MKGNTLNNGYVWLNDMSQQFLSRDYLLPGQTVDERVDIICNRAEEILKHSMRDGEVPEIIQNFASRFKNMIQKGWCSLSTPIWTNFGTTKRQGLPISCFGSNVEDDMASILYAQAEIGMMSKFGGGVSVFLGKLRHRGAAISGNGESSGAVHFGQLFESTINLISQGGTRRGNGAIYLPIDHKDITEWLTIRREGSPLQDISYGITVPDYWMREMIAGDPAKRETWAAVLQARSKTGYPYIMFSDTANRGKPEVYKDMEITHSNLCSEIMLPDNEEESFVCDLSSMNLLHYDAWKGTDAVKLMTYFLDAVMTEFIEKASKFRFMERAVRFAERHRAIGIGELGWHSLLQSKMIPFESFEAKFLNVEIIQHIREEAYKASGELAVLYGEPHYLRGHSRRNTTLLAIAPTKSSAFILGQVSEGIEPIRSNYFVGEKAKGKFTEQNMQLMALLESKGQNTDEVWKSILVASGSVQHLEFLSEHEKDVFKTFSEINPREVIIQAGARQRFIDQGQSLNLMIHPSMPIKDVNALYILAWELGVKALYYQISVSAAQEFSRSLLDCVSCSA